MTFQLSLFTAQINGRKNNLEKLTQQNIIEGCKKQSALYQRALVMQYSEMLMTVSKRYAPDIALAKDVLQEAFIKILNAIPNYKEEGKFEAWMKKIVINTALKYFDKSCFKYENTSIGDIQESAHIPPEAYTHLGTEELIKVIDSLPDGYREVFNLFAIEGYSHREIGELLGIAESSSRSQLTRARTLLKNMLCSEAKSRMQI